MARSKATSAALLRLATLLSGAGAAFGGEVEGPPLPTAGAAVVERAALSDERVSALGASTSSSEARPLGPAPAPAASAPVGEAPVRRVVPASSGWRTAGALAGVLGLIFIVRWAFVRLARGRGGIVGHFGAGGRAPSGLLEVLGRYPVARGQTLVLLRVDRRVLLLSQASAGFTTLAELRDADDVASILAKTMDDEGASMAGRFQRLLRGMERDPSIVEEVETIEAPAVGRETRFSRRIARDFAPAERSSAVASVKRRLSALRGDAA